MARHKDAFLVNVWFEYSETHGERQSVAWRGSVEHLVSHQRRYFTDVVELVGFLTSFAPHSSRDDRESRA